MDDQTLTSHLLQIEQPGACLPVLTVLWHPHLERMGEQAPLIQAGVPIALNRYTPLFGRAGAMGQPLAHSCISRTPLQLQLRGDGSIQLLLAPGRMHCEVNGVRLEGELTLGSADIAAGVVLQLGGQVVLCLHHSETLPQAGEGTLMGVSSAMQRVRRQVALAAATDLPVLVLGESGTGKELVAQAIHAASLRAQRAMVTVNMAAMAESLAAADLFGCVKGAFTGAQAARVGLWAEADRSTLFLDEVGDAPAAVQPMLLRAIETGEFRPLGSSRVQHADVRLIAATDRTLEAGKFNQPLLRRLEAFVIRTPSLRVRREDLGILIRHSLESQQLPKDWPAQVPATLVRALCLHSWPGNVRQLLHAIRRLVLSARTADWPTPQDLLGADLPVASSEAVRAPPSSAAASLRRAYAAPSSVTAEALLAALDRAGWCLRTAALDLGISRPSLYNLIERHPAIRRAEVIAREEIAAAIGSGAGHLTALAMALRTPRDALRRRMRLLELDVPA